LLLLPPLLWPLLVTELALVLVLVPSVAMLLVSLVLVLSATVLVWPLWLLLVLAMPIKSISFHNYFFM
jgi:fatty acid desaturase